MNIRNKQGFTLIEILVTLVIVSVAVLSLGGFTLSMVASGQVSRERLTAVHIAEQVLEFWQHDPADRPPSIATATCELSQRAANPTSYPVIVNCAPNVGAGNSYKIKMSATPAQAPLPTDPNLNAYLNWPTKNPNGTNQKILNNPSSPNQGSFGIRPMINYSLTGSPSPMVKAVTISWSHKGKTHSVYLTHLSEVK